ncbi:hypothetical protein PVAND_008100 [Polypedilum vanderplanki]|uniref:J domain-containing protein n=1 Tax=Polypedilum vanderplanki TaxID=319348 RepID=A0A9J6C8R6_POLVA|nr:hypothetical protein PVAND_008100 [Polypedilum vanderplanki]
MGLDYYAILNVKRDASIFEIKMAYRKLALLLHPLRKQYQQHPNPMPEGTFDLPLPKLNDDICWEFINEAYDVLSNELWRQIFDLYGEEGLKRGVAAPNGFIPPYTYHKDAMRTYFEFFGSYSPYSDLIDAATNPPPLYKVIQQGIGVIHQDPEIIHKLHVTLEEVYNGTIKKYNFTRKEFTDEWKMTTVDREIELVIPIKAGCIEGTRFVFNEYGDQSLTRKAADIVFIACENKHDIYRRDGNNLHMKYSISLKEALSGFIASFKTLDDRKIDLYITDVVHCNFEKHLENEGLPDISNQNLRGDLIIHFDIKFPLYIPKTLREKLKEIFDEIEDYEKENECSKMCLQDCD